MKKIKDRQRKFDLDLDGANDLDMYGQKKLNDKFENDDPFALDNGADDAADFQRLDNGMVVNQDLGQMNKQN